MKKKEKEPRKIQEIQNAYNVLKIYYTIILKNLELTACTDYGKLHI